MSGRYDQEDRFACLLFWLAVALFLLAVIASFWAGETQVHGAPAPLPKRERSWETQPFPIGTWVANKVDFQDGVFREYEANVSITFSKDRTYRERYLDEPNRDCEGTWRFDPYNTSRINVRCKRTDEGSGWYYEYRYDLQDDGQLKAGWHVGKFRPTRR